MNSSNNISNEDSHDSSNDKSREIYVEKSNLNKKDYVPEDDISATDSMKDNTVNEHQPDPNHSNEESLNEDENESTNSDGESNSSPEFNNKRIILQRFTIYNSSTTMYIVGSNAKESLFRILEIGKDPNDNEELIIIEDKSYFYTRKDMIELLNGLDESIDGGVHKIAQGYGLLGLIRFTKGYYLSIITKCSQVAILGGHYIYHTDETKLIPLDINYRRPEKYSDEERLLSIFKYLDLGKTFYFSYAYDITNSLQTNFLRNKKLATEYQQNLDSDTRSKIHSKIDDSTSFEHNERFVWNNLLLKPLLANPDIATYEWFQPIIHGFIDQANISVYGKKFYITIIARRSHHFAGARFLKRGVNDKGNVANEIETEQIVSDMLVSSFHDAKYGFYNNPRYTSFVQHRGSIPLYWTQDLNRLPKPPIEINLSDPYYQSSAIHFNNLFQRYGSPVIILNLIKTKEKQPRESKLNLHFTNCIKYLNQFLPEEHKLRYHSFDMSKHSKKNLDVISPLQNIASKAIEETGFFHNGIDLSSTELQRGIIRTNCIDCLDRTNAAQFIICKEALSHQLRSLGLIPDTKNLEYDSDLINILTEMFHDHGDTIAVQYGGSNLVNTMDSYRRINQWSSHTRDILNSVKRIYSNSFMDSIRQEAINLFLGNYIYDASKPKLWELQNDFYLHNAMTIENIRVKSSYVHWFNEKYLSSSRFSLQNKESKADDAEIVQKLNPYPDYNDNWFNECYVPRKFQSFTEVFQFNMNSNARYFPSNLNNDPDKLFDYSPFESRKNRSDELYPSSKAPLAINSNIKGSDQYSSLKLLEEKNEYATNRQYRSFSPFESNGPIHEEEDSRFSHPGRIKSFLANKIEKLGYSAKSTQKSFRDEKIDYLERSNLLSNGSSDLLGHFSSELPLEPRVNEVDMKLYLQQCDLPNLTTSRSSESFRQNYSTVSTNSDDSDIYKYYTSVLTNCASSNSESRENGFVGQLSYHNSQDLKLYSKYLGIEEDKPFDFNAQDEYFN